MSEVRGRPASMNCLDEARKVAEPADNSVFGGRHSEPRDPTTGPSSTGPTTKKLSDSAAVGGVKDESEDPTLIGSEALKRTVSNSARNPDPDHISFIRYASPSPEGPQHTRVLSFAGVGAHPYSTSLKFSPAKGIRDRGPKGRENGHNHDHEDEIRHWQYPHYLTRHTTGRNAQFYGLSKAEREHLGGVEYRAITLLAYVVPMYFILWQLLGCIGLGAYMAHNKASTARENGIDPWYARSLWPENAANWIGGWVSSMVLQLSTIPGCRCWMQTW